MKTSPAEGALICQQFNDFKRSKKTVNIFISNFYSKENKTQYQDEVKIKIGKIKLEEQHKISGMQYVKYAKMLEKKLLEKKAVSTKDQKIQKIIKEIHK